jgi:hypothetical protein
VKFEDNPPALVQTECRRGFAAKSWGSTRGAGEDFASEEQRLRSAALYRESKAQRECPLQ